MFTRTHSVHHRFNSGSVRSAVVAVAVAVVVAFTPAASADVLFKISDGLYVWSGPSGNGMANCISPGNWVGSGWDTFPGVSPPWNPVGGVSDAVSLAIPRPPVVPVTVQPVTVPVVAPVAVHVHITIAPPAPVPAPMYLSINGESVRVPDSLR